MFKMASQSWLFSLILTKGTNKASQGVTLSLIHTEGPLRGRLRLTDSCKTVSTRWCCSLCFVGFKLANSALDFNTCVGLERCWICGSLSDPEVSAVGLIHTLWNESQTSSSLMIVFPRMRLLLTSSVYPYASFYFYQPVHSLYSTFCILS